MKCASHIIVLAGLLIVTAAHPLYSAKERSSESRKPTPAATSTDRISAKATDKKTPDVSRGAGSVPTRSTGLTEKRGIELPKTDVTEPVAPSDQSRSAASDLKLDWISINHGGAIEVASGNLKMGLSIAQPVAGEVRSGDLTMGLGFWYGAGAAGTDCLCPHQTDLDSDGFSTALDLGWLIDIIFAGTPDFPNPGCPTSRGDFDNDGFATALDIAWLIDYIFANGPGPCDPCNPVQTPCAE